MLRKHFSENIFSSVYQTAARDEEDQHDFLNAVAKIETEKTPEEIHTMTTKIENDLGKDPPYQKGPRTIDLDILLYESTSHAVPAGRQESRVTSSELTIPHPRMHERRFVLEPLCELCDEQKWHDLLKKTANQDCRKTDLTL